jgi:hypothetical protein
MCDEIEAQQRVVLIKCNDVEIKKIEEENMMSEIM